MKYGVVKSGGLITAVALFTRAWIEIFCTSVIFDASTVALFTRAWIEIIALAIIIILLPVALFTRAWIEIAFYLSW